MRRLPDGIRNSGRTRHTKTASILAATALFFAAPLMTAAAQTAPENLRINLEPAKPGIRSVLIDKKYKPIISRDDEGVVIDTIGSAPGLPDCTVTLEITLENSRVLHRDADICTGDTVVVDVKSGGASVSASRVVGGTTGPVAPSREPAPESAPVITAQPSQPQQQSSSPQPSENTTGQQRQSDANQTSGSDTLLKPLEPARDPIAAPSDLPSIVQESLARQSAGSAAAAGEVTISPSGDRTWHAETGTGPGDLSQLIHGVPGTNDTDFRAYCRTQSGDATVVFSQTNRNVRDGVSHPVRISAADFSRTYDAVGSPMNNQTGQSYPQITLPMSDPLWQELVRQREITVEVQGLPPYQVSLKGSASPVKRFMTVCSQAQQIISDNPIGGYPDTEPGADLSCNELGRVRSPQGANAPGQIVFRNTGQTPVSVYWIDYNGNERHYARLMPGQILEQQTFNGHAWLVRGANGQCRGIYVSRTPYREVYLTGPASVSGPVQPQGNFPPHAPYGTQPGRPIAPGPIPPANIGGSLNQPASLARPGAAGRVADYLCTAGVDLNVRFSPDGRTATVAEMGYGVFTLTRQGGEGSFNYAGQGYMLKGHLQNATWSRPGQRDVFCAKR
ncbi:hypothetical protein [Roseibium sp. RKSG952]|uniref:VHL beta domain-containing protein n=1 Tax=Roseibium sp. RKSG952 TaxID=2529384 RepID=UPI0012BCEDA5|nr:hypothetical protein [Roseibium sp. RKSG952]MTI01137.1 hypothetical protein [Roseibium sp. RKSG952]